MTKNSFEKLIIIEKRANKIKKSKFIKVIGTGKR